MPLNKVSPTAQIGRNVTIGDFTIIHDNVVIGDGSTIDSHCVVGYPSRLALKKTVVIGPNSTVRSHSVIYEGCTFGERLTTGHAVHIRENTQAGRYVQVGTNSDIQGDCVLGNFVKLHSEVHISKASRVGDFVWIYPRTQFTNDPFPPSHIVESILVDDLAVIATNTLVLPGIRIGLASFVAAGSVLRAHVPDLHCVGGVPAKTFATIDRFYNMKYNLGAPWPSHYRDAYPPESQPLLDVILTRVNAAIELRRIERENAA